MNDEPNNKLSNDQSGAVEPTNTVQGGVPLGNSEYAQESSEEETIRKDTKPPKITWI